MQSPRHSPCVESLESRRLLSQTAADVQDVLPADPTAARPNFLFILTDDLDADSVRYMPRVQELLGGRGLTFENAFVTNPVCCPSNVSILTGQYSKNTQILHNVPPLGGFQKFTDMRTDGDPATQGDENTLATWLDDAGYLTGRVGKYLVGYPDRSTYIPPGWDQWQASYDGFSSYFNYRMNQNGTVVQYGAGEEEYLTDVLTGKSVDFIEDAEAADDQPFFLMLSANAPHSGTAPNGAPTPAPRHVGMFAGVTAPRTPSFNEADVSDKPSNIRNLPPLTAAQIANIDREYQARIESLQAVDEGVERILNTLEENGELENTFIFFTSDNGYHLGQHRLLNGKAQPYEEDIRVPLLVSGPGVRQGASLDQFALNIDFAPTIAELAQATPGRAVDGRSLAPLLVRDTPPSHNWRKDFLVEFYRAPGQPGSPGKVLRTRHEVYVEYADGFRELYDLRTDPYQLDNVFSSADKGHVKNLSERLAELVASRGESSRDVRGSAPASARAPADQVRVNPFFALTPERRETVLNSDSAQAGQSVWDDEPLNVAVFDAALTGAPFAAT
jgi:arylsulfatase A-like enzyme